MPETKTPTTILPRHREAAWPHAPACYRDDPNPGARERWMAGVYDDAARIIRTFAEFEASLAETGADARDKGVAALAWTRKAIEIADDLLTDWMSTGKVDHMEDRWYSLREALTGSRPRLEELEAAIDAPRVVG